MKRLSPIRRATLTAVTLFTLLSMHASPAPAQEGGEGGEGDFWGNFPELLCLFGGHAACYSISKGCERTLIPDYYCDKFFEECVHIVVEVCL